MALEWDKAGEHYIETGVRHGILWVAGAAQGVAWNGLTSVKESPEGAESTPLYADDINYISLISAETFKGTIEAYTYPKEFAACDGSAVFAEGGLQLGQQARKPFGFAYETRIANDTEGMDAGKKLHIIWGATAQPSEKSYATINDKPDAVAFSWAINSTPVAVDGHPELRPTSSATIDSTIVGDKVYKTVEALLASGKQPSPGELITAIETAMNPGGGG